MTFVRHHWKTLRRMPQEPIWLVMVVGCLTFIALNPHERSNYVLLAIFTIALPLIVTMKERA